MCVEGQKEEIGKLKLFCLLGKCFKPFLDLFYMCQCFACMYAPAPHMSLAFAVVRRQWSPGMEVTDG